MVEEKAFKTHLIVTDIHEEYDVKWTGRLIDARPLLRNGLPVFVLSSSVRRMELNTIDVRLIEECAKQLTEPHGRAAVTTDRTYIYLKEIDGNERLMGSVTHRHVKTYAPMYDKIAYRR